MIESIEINFPIAVELPLGFLPLLQSLCTTLDADSALERIGLSAENENFVTGLIVRFSKPVDMTLSFERALEGLVYSASFMAQAKNREPLIEIVGKGGKQGDNSESDMSIHCIDMCVSENSEESTTKAKGPKSPSDMYDMGDLHVTFVSLIVEGIQEVTYANKQDTFVITIDTNIDADMNCVMFGHKSKPNSFIIDDLVVLHTLAVGLSEYLTGPEEALKTLQKYAESF